MRNGIELSKRFALCTFAPITNDLSESSRIVSGDEGFATTSFLMDSSGRSKFNIPLQIVCPTKEDVEFLVGSGCLPGGENADDDDDDAAGALRFEVTSHAPNHHADKVVTVEDIRIISSYPSGNSIILDAELVVRAAHSDPNTQSTKAAFHRSIIAEIEDDTFILEVEKGGRIKFSKTAINMEASKVASGKK